MKFRPGRLHYRAKLSLVLSSVILIPMVIFIILYYIFAVGYTQKRQLEDYRTWLESALHYVQENIDDVLVETERFETEGILLSYLKAPTRYDTAQKIDIATLNKTILESISAMTTADIARSVEVYGYYISEEMITPGPMFSMELLEKTHPDIVDAFRSSNRTTLYQMTYLNSEASLLSAEDARLNVYRATRDIYGNVVAINRICFPLTYFSGEIAPLPISDGFLIYAVENGASMLLYSGQAEAEQCAAAYAEYFSEGKPERIEEYAVLAAELNFSAGKGTAGLNDSIYFFVPESGVRSQNDAFLFKTVIVALVAVLLVVVTVQIVSHQMTKRLYQLLADISGDTEGLVSGEKQLVADDFDEFGWIKGKFNDIVSEMQSCSEKAMRAEYEQRILKAELMQDLIAPHFLYNTLDGLRWSTDDPNLIRVIDHMVNFYRLALNKGEPFVTMTQEIEMVQSYLEVQGFSYESEFRYEINVQDSLRDVRILKNLLQPILENALIHGIDKRGDHGLIRISAREENGHLLIEISDNGAGMSEQKIAQLMDGSAKTGYGIHNVIQRIALFYGKEGSVQITSVPEKGTTVHITLPLRKLPERED